MPIRLVRREAIAWATEFGRYPSCSIAASTFSLVAGATGRGPLLIT